MKILLAQNPGPDRQKLALLLAGLGYEVLPPLAPDAARAAIAEGPAPDLAMVAASLLGEWEFLGSMAVGRAGPRPMTAFLLLDREDPQTVSRALLLGVRGFLKLPVQPRELAPVLIREASGAPRNLIAGFSLPSILQLVEIERRSCLVEAIPERGRPGYLIFADGAMVDAFHASASGSEAAIEMMTWPEVSIEMRPPLPVAWPPRGIEAVAALGLEAARRSDELQAASRTRGFAAVIERVAAPVPPATMAEAARPAPAVAPGLPPGPLWTVVGDGANSEVSGPGREPSLSEALHVPETEVSPEDLELLARVVERVQRRRVEIPVMPATYVKLMDLTRNASVGLDEIAKTVSQDQSLAVTVLRMANSALLGSQIGVTRVQEAVLRLGLRRLRGLILAASMESVLIKGEDALQEAWRRSLACAQTCSALAQRVGADAGEAFLLGLLHCVHKVLLIKTCHDLKTGRGDELAGSAVFGFLSRLFFEKVFDDVVRGWRLPDPVASALRALVEGRDQTSLLYLARLLVEIATAAGNRRITWSQFAAVKDLFEHHRIPFEEADHWLVSTAEAYRHAGGLVTVS